MRINYINYHNYRCFPDLSIRFDTTTTKNISLVLGINGAGKTEILFSFQWVLYGFDFKNLREKEETPYSLNSGLYHELEINRNTNSKDCWVEISFSNKGNEYFMKRTETFTRINDKIQSHDKVSFSYTKPNGERTTEETNKEIVEEIISRIIPKSILEGITFDGERMKKLNVAEQSKGTIKNVISLVTNEKLFGLCSSEIKDLKSDINREIRTFNKKTNNVSLDELNNRITDYEDTIKENELKLEIVKKNNEKIQNRLEQISDNLSLLKESHQLEQKRKGLEKDLDTSNKNFNKNLELFSERLVDGYALITDQLVDDVKSSIESIDIPTGLTVEAVKSIIKRPRCICGCEMNDSTIQKLTELLSTLPPDNISSTILYMANQFEGEKRRAKKLIHETFELMRQSRDESDEIKSKLSQISSSLISDVSNEVMKLENERTELHQQKGIVKQSEEKYKHEIERNKKLLKDAKKELEEASITDKQLYILNAQQKVLELFKDAIIKIEESNREQSLLSVNNYLTNAFVLLSEDTGRRIHLCQHNKNEKYSLVTYLQSKYDKLYNSWINSGKIKTLEDEGLSENEIHENILLRVIEGKSTGQSKINSLAFAKAILDYSNEDRTNDQFKVSHDYPFLIDSPFTELSGKNIENVAEHIHSFASQIILMADDKSYGLIKKRVEPYVCSITRLVKNEVQGITYKE